MVARYEKYRERDKAFVDRNLLQMALVRICLELGYDAGLGYSPDYDAPVVYADLDPGVIGYHLRPQHYCDNPSWLPERDEDLPVFHGYRRVQRLETFIAEGPNLPDEITRDL